MLFEAKDLNNKSIYFTPTEAKALFYNKEQYTLLNQRYLKINKVTIETQMGDLIEGLYESSSHIANTKLN